MPEPTKELCAEVERLRREIESLTAKTARLRSIAINAWLEAWRDGNQFVAVEPDAIEESSYRSWKTSETLKQLKALDS